MEGYCEKSCGKCSCAETDAPSRPSAGVPEGERNFFGAKAETAEAEDGADGEEAPEDAKSEAELAAQKADGECSNVWDVLGTNPDMSELKAVLERTDLLPVIQDSNFAATFFAPTNDAFTAFKKSLGKKSGGLLDDSDFLGKVVGFHIALPPLFEVAMKPGDVLRTFEGDKVGEKALVVVESDGGDSPVALQAFGNPVANFLDTDILACKSVVHVIDSVMMSSEAIAAIKAAPKDRSAGPKGKKAEPGDEEAESEEQETESEDEETELEGDEEEAGASVDPIPDTRKSIAGTGEPLVEVSSECKSVFETARSHPDLGPLVTAMRKGEVDEIFSDEEQVVTVFAPTAAAFEMLEKRLGSKAGLLDDPSFLQQVLAYHTTLSPLFLEDMSNGDSIPATIATATGLEASKGTLKVFETSDGAGIGVKGYRNKGTILEADLKACNSVVHVIDKVLISREMAKTMQAAEAGSSADGGAAEGEATATQADAASEGSEDEVTEQAAGKKKGKRSKNRKMGGAAEGPAAPESPSS
eukprot:evm.model.scf_2355.1 EVM.evm.TU.scf_2355.1   scf_2355:2940-7233(-)